MGTNPRVCFLGGMGRRSLVDYQGRKVFKKKSKELFFWWCVMGWLEKGGGSILFFILLYFVTW